MSFTIKLQRMTTQKNRIDKSGHITDVREVTGELREASSIMRPTIRFRINDVSGLRRTNYMYIEEWSRYYFVDDITSYRNNIVEVSGHVDVLYTFKDEILANTGLIHRSGNNYSLYLDDSQFKVYNCPHILTKNFPSGFPSDNEFLLAVSGS